MPVNVQLDPELEVSFTTRGKHRAPCFRKGKTRWIPPKHTYLRFADVSKGSKAWAASWKPLNKSHSITYVVAAKSKA